ncbi:MAG: pyrroline-5-carboxylate reductase, partial [Planctomycetales bacterium]|nr:pyrroline-5-carboxylate reductase [Planctomycetales bacterium]
MPTTLGNLGFIGAGRMASALASGCVAAGLTDAASIHAADPFEPARDGFTATIPGAKVTADNAAVLAACDAVVLAVKPQMMADVLAGLRDRVEPRHLLVSIAAGTTLARLAEQLPADTRLVRVMPNTPCLIREGASCFSRGAMATDADAQLVASLLESVGIAREVDEPLLDAVTGLSGSGPAFIYTAIEAMAAGAVAMGMTAELALELAAATARGAAGMIRSTGRSPAELRDQVTSPGGTTLAGLQSLEKSGGAAAFQAAVEAATKRSIELGKS